MKRSTWAWLAVVAACAGLIIAGCGGAAASSQSVTGAGSSITPATAIAFAAIDSDLNSSQWTALKALLDKFPGKQQALTSLRQSFERSSNGVTWSQVKSALGPEIDVAVFDATPKPYVVGMTQPNDTSAFDSLVSKANASSTSSLHVADYKGWKIFSNSQAHLDAFEQGLSGGALSDDATYTQANGKLSGDALAKVYANGAKLADALKAKLPQLGTAQAQTQTLVWAAGQLLASDGGLTANVVAKTSDAQSAPQPYEAKLVDEVPAGALAFLSFNGESFKSASFSQALQGLSGIPQAATLLPLLKQFGAIFAHENALYVLPSVGIPEVTLVAQPDSPEQATAAIDGLLSLAGKSAGVSPPKSVTINGVSAKAVTVRNVTIYYGVDGGKLIVSSSQAAFGQLGGSGQKLSGDSTFTDALKAAGMPSKTDGFLYVNLKDSIPYVESLAQLANAKISPQVTENLQPLRTLLGWATSSGGGEGSGSVFLGIK
jgi:hypothetical protein